MVSSCLATAGEKGASCSDRVASFVGILMLETFFPRLLGDIGHPDTYDFPVVRRVVEGARSSNVVISCDESLAKPFTEAALALQDAGAVAVATSCGFLARFQSQVSKSLEIPFLSSSLLQMPLVYAMIKPKRIGILTARATGLSDAHFSECGAADIPRTIIGMEGSHFYRIYVENERGLDVNLARSELLLRAKTLLRDDSNIGAIVLECTNMSPFRGDIALNTGLPVFDITTLIEYVRSGVLLPSRSGGSI